MLYVGDDLTSHHVCTLEELLLYAPALGLVLYNQAHYPLRTARCRCDHRWEHHFLSHTAATIRLVSDLGLCQYHQVKATDMYFLDGLREPVSPAIVDV